MIIYLSTQVCSNSEVCSELSKLVSCSDGLFRILYLSIQVFTVMCWGHVAVCAHVCLHVCALGGCTL